MEILKKNIDKLHQIYLIASLMGFILACISLLFFPKYVADNSLWDYAAGWQREIGFWNIGIIVLIIYALKVKNEQLNLGLTISIITITSLFGTHHLINILIYQKIAQVNLGCVIMNYIASILGIGVIVIKKLK